MASPNAAGRWRPAPTWTAAFVYWLIAVLASRIQARVGLGADDGVGVISVAFFLLVAVCLATWRQEWPLWKRAVGLPAAFVAHVLFTIPAAAALGVLMR